MGISFIFIKTFQAFVKRDLKGDVPPLIYDYASADFFDSTTSIQWYIVHAGKLCNVDSIVWQNKFNKELYLFNYSNNIFIILDILTWYKTIQKYDIAYPGNIGTRLHKLVLSNNQFYTLVDKYLFYFSSSVVRTFSATWDYIFDIPVSKRYAYAMASTEKGLIVVHGGYGGSEHTTTNFGLNVIPLKDTYTYNAIIDKWTSIEMPLVDFEVYSYSELIHLYGEVMILLSGTKRFHF
jgi:hypothetical protein